MTTFDEIRALSQSGASRAEVARALRISLSGLRTTLYRELGTTVWPIAATPPPKGEVA